MKATGGRGVDVVLEMAAHINLDKDLGCSRAAAASSSSATAAAIEIDPRQAMGRDAAILGMMLFNVAAAELAAIHAALVAGLANGTLNPVVGREMPLAERRARTRPCWSQARSARSSLIP